MSLFSPPFEFRYRCRQCKIRFDETRQELSYVERKCPRCGSVMEECRNLHIGVSTDSTFMRGSDDGFKNDDASRKKARAIARAAGVSPEGKKYFPNLAKRQFDPEAWMSGKGDVKKRCEQNGWGCDGAVSVKPVEFDSPGPLDGPYQVDAALVDKEISAKEMLAGERMSGKERERMKDTLMTKYSGEQD